MKIYHTHQRQLLIDFLQSNPDKAYTIEEIIGHVNADELSKSTVYRLMTKLVGDGLVHRSVKGNSRTFVYQFINSEKCEGHLHIKCTDCGKVYHLDSAVSSEIKNDVSSSGFEIDSHTVLLGKCGKCRK